MILAGYLNSQEKEFFIFYREVKESYEFVLMKEMNLMMEALLILRSNETERILFFVNIKAETVSYR